MRLGGGFFGLSNISGLARWTEEVLVLIRARAMVPTRRRVPCSAARHRQTPGTDSEAWREQPLAGLPECVLPLGEIASVIVGCIAKGTSLTYVF
jgi:hypothetical protein